MISGVTGTFTILHLNTPHPANTSLWMLMFQATELLTRHASVIRDPS
jgi:hypothetical protein